jgi:hypothetical protein
MTVKERPNLNTEIKQCNKKIHYKLGKNSESFTAATEFMGELKSSSSHHYLLVPFM